MLSLPAKQAIFRSMAPLTVSAWTEIIKQGDTDATKFYILEKGTCHVMITSPDTSGEQKKAHTYSPGRCALQCPESK